ncbi:hypothetical protein HC928_12000 [bacterium]|nr:hypothetical protein [bacterium]
MEIFSMPPAMASLHYGQLIFEGLKAYRNNEGKINIFRMDENWKRMNFLSETFGDA